MAQDGVMTQVFFPAFTVTRGPNKKSLFTALEVGINDHNHPVSFEVTAILRGIHLDVTGIERISIDEFPHAAMPSMTTTHPDSLEYYRIKGIWLNYEGNRKVVLEYSPFYRMGLVVSITV